MERKISLIEAQKIMGNNFIGPVELESIKGMFPFCITTIIPEIPITSEELKKYSEDYILILGVTEMGDNVPLNILSMRNFFGIEPDTSQPCFYNQDWYLSENFIQTTLENKWYLIKKDIILSTRAELPESILKQKICFPSAILCAYTFFVYYFITGEYLWYHDFVWCADSDHNDDRIYVGKYNDIDGINKNGFSIHRHLSLRNCYGAIDCK